MIEIWTKYHIVSARIATLYIYNAQINLQGMTDNGRSHLVLGTLCRRFTLSSDQDK